METGNMKTSDDEFITYPKDASSFRIETGADDDRHLDDDAHVHSVHFRSVVNRRGKNSMGPMSGSTFSIPVEKWFCSVGGI